jgi:hypothetical protein
VISGVPDSFSIALVSGYPIYLTEASGMSGYNGTWYFDIVRTKAGCVLSATDSETFDVAYNMSDPDYAYDINYTQRVGLGVGVARTSSFLDYVTAFISHSAPDYYANVILSGEAYGQYIHPMIGVAFEPSDSTFLRPDSYGGNPDDGVTFVEGRSVGFDAGRLTDVISGDLRFYLSRAPGDQHPIIPDFTDTAWDGIGTFWDTGTSDFKIAGTFTAEIERL